VTDRAEHPDRSEIKTFAERAAVSPFQAEPAHPSLARIAGPIVIRDPRYGLTNHSNYAMPAHPGGGEA
jgi:hypothetical protein